MTLAFLGSLGDALQFIGGVPHGPAALVELPIQFHQGRGPVQIGRAHV